MSNYWFQYTKAIVREVASSFSEGALKLEEPDEAINLTKAKEQWSKYVATLKNLGLEVTEIESDEKFPDCVFIEDPAVVCDGTALITRPGHASRRGETLAVRNTLEKLGLSIFSMHEPACMDGGDVLFTGREFFVGLTTRTNKQGMESLAKAFSNYPVTAIDMGEAGNVLHLKSLITMAGPELIAVGQNPAGENVLSVIEKKGTFKYNKLLLPENKAANVLYINGTMVRQAAHVIPKSIKILRSLNCRQMEVDMSEFAKADGCLSCCSLLIK